jgi:hypothetical protein
MSIGNFKLERALPKKQNLTRLVNARAADEDFDDLVEDLTERAIRRQVKEARFRRTPLAE